MQKFTSRKSEADERNYTLATCNSYNRMTLICYYYSIQVSTYESMATLISYSTHARNDP